MTDKDLLSELLNQLKEIKSNGIDILINTAEELLNKKPAPDRWSPAEQIDYLIITQNQYLDKISSTLESNSKRGNYKSFKPGIFSRWFIKMMEPPIKKSLATYTIFTPTSNLSKNELTSKFERSMLKMNEIITYAVSKKKLKIKISSPVSGLIKFEAGGAIMTVLAHNRRHIWLCRKILEGCK